MALYNPKYHHDDVVKFLSNPDVFSRPLDYANTHIQNNGEIIDEYEIDGKNILIERETLLELLKEVSGELPLS